jgi:endonuclease YncB( thermonuclease family)
MAREPAEFGNHPSPFVGGAFRAVCRHVVDGDTFDALVDLGFNQYAYATIRLRGVNTAEMRGGTKPERARGLAAKERAKQLVEGKPVVLRTLPDPTTFGRYVADVHFQHEGRWVDLGQMLLTEDLALPIPG